LTERSSTVTAAPETKGVPGLEAAPALALPYPVML
jgi:hypothetical protein